MIIHRRPRRIIDIAKEEEKEKNSDNNKTFIDADKKNIIIKTDNLIKK